jgi:hypothetical protein
MKATRWLREAGFDVVRKTLRCVALLGLAALAIAPVVAQDTTPLTLMTAGNGSAFLPMARASPRFLLPKASRSK